MFRTLGLQLKKPSGLVGKLVGKIMEKGNREIYEKMINQLELKKGDKIYEIGFGSGLGIDLIARKKTSVILHGIDYSELMVGEATKRNRPLIDDGTVNLRLGDFMTAPVMPGKYDKVFCVNVIYFWSDLNRAFVKVYSMLNENGLFCIFMVPDKYLMDRRFAEEFFKHPIEKVVTELQNAGFKSIEYSLDKGYYIKARK